MPRLQKILGLTDSNMAEWSGTSDLESDELSLQFIRLKLQEKEYKLCPWCKIPFAKDEACNYVKCACGGEWCWTCEKKKFLECNDKSHNSH